MFIDFHELPDEDTLRRAAEETMTRPSDAAFWGKRMYTTHGPVYSYADRSGEDLPASNLATLAEMLDIPVDMADDYRALPGAGDESESGHAFVASVGHWAVGSLLQVWVQVHSDTGEDWTAIDAPPDDGVHDYVYAYTPAFVAAVQAAGALQDYPVLDEQDFSAREWESFHRGLTVALGDAWSDLEREAGVTLDPHPDLVAYVAETLAENYDGGYGYGYGAAWSAVTAETVMDALAAVAAPDGQGTLPLPA